MNLVDKIGELHRALDAGKIPYAFGGALALAWCTQRARATIDIDVNIFVEAADSDAALAALPPGVQVTDEDRTRIAADGQTRLWWETTPVDVFFNTTDFHVGAQSRARVEKFAGEQVSFLACSDLAVFKAFFDRTKDWADLEEMVAAETLDVDRVLGVLTRYLGGDDHRIQRLRSIVD